MTIDRRYSVAEGTAFKAPCRVATTANITLGGLQTIDGVTVAEHDRVLVKNQTDTTLNGIYEASTGNWLRTKDFDGARDIVKGTKVFVSSGTHERIEYTVTSSDPITIGTSAITFTAAGDSILEQAQTAADAAAAYAALLGNQVANFDSYVLAQTVTVLPGIKGLRVFGWSLCGDGPQAEYFRVMSEPSTPAGKLRTADFFRSDGSTDATNGGWWQLVISGRQDVRRFGIFAGGGDVTTRVQNALSTCSIFFPPGVIGGVYTIFGDILPVSDRHIEIQKGALVTNTGGRFTSHIPGGGNIDFEVNGDLGFIATATAPQLGDWPTSLTFGDERALIEFGGSAASPIRNCHAYGTGRIHSDYVWTGPPTAFYDAHAQINRKGIAFWNATHCSCGGSASGRLEVDHIHGEAVYFNGYAISEDINFSYLYIHHFAFNGINFNVSLPYIGLLIGHNVLTNGMQGIEISGGVADSNTISDCTNGIVTGAGAGITVQITRNKIYNNTLIGISAEFASTVKDVVISDNEVTTSGADAYRFNNISGARVQNNKSSYHATTTSGKSFIVGAGCGPGYYDGNVTFQPTSAHSTGDFTNLAGVTPTFGNNPTI